MNFAKIFGIEQGLYSRIETGKRPPPELPVLVMFADHLGIPRESEEFAELLSAADHDRNPAAHKIALTMHGGKLWNPFNRLGQNEVACGSLNEMVSKAMQKALDVQAIAISVKSPTGRVTSFALQPDQPRPARSKARRNRTT